MIFYEIGFCLIVSSFVKYLCFFQLPNFNQKKDDFIDRMERNGMGPWNAKENGNGSFPNPGGDSLTQNLRNQLNKSGKFNLNRN